MTQFAETMLGEDLLGAINIGGWKYSGPEIVKDTLYQVTLNLNTMTIEKAEVIDEQWIKERF